MELETQTAIQNANCYVSQLLSDYPEGVEVQALHDLYTKYRPHDCMELDFISFRQMLFSIWAIFGSVEQASISPMIIRLRPERKPS